MESNGGTWRDLFDSDGRLRNEAVRKQVAKKLECKESELWFTITQHKCDGVEVELSNGAMGTSASGHRRNSDGDGDGSVDDSHGNLYSSLSQIPVHRIKSEVTAMKRNLLDIVNGTVYSARHVLWVRSGRFRRSLSKFGPSGNLTKYGDLTDAQDEVVGECLDNMFVQRENGLAWKYVSAVLTQECLYLLVLKCVRGISIHAEAVAYFDTAITQAGGNSLVSSEEEEKVEEETKEEEEKVEESS